MASLVRFSRVVLLLVPLLLAAVFVPVKLLDENGADRVERLEAELQTLKEGNQELRRQNDSYAVEIRSFYADPRYIEKVARDELGMVGPNEFVYQFPEGADGK